MPLFPDRSEPHGKPLREYVPVRGRTPYYVETYMFGALPAGLLYIFYKSWLRGDPGLLYFTSAMIACVFVFIGFMFVFARKHFVYSVGIYDQGISVYRFLDYSFIRWAELRSFQPSEGVFTKHVGVLTTTNSRLHLPTLVKDRNGGYPHFKAGFGEAHWVEKDGTQSEVTFENSPLYRDIAPRIPTGAAKSR